MKFHRRIVTNGRVFRIQYQPPDGAGWDFYDGSYLQLADAQATMDRWNAADAAQTESTWTVVEPEQVPA